MIVHLIVVFFGKHAYTRLQISPEARQKGRFVTLACKKLSFCLAYEVKPRNRQFSHAQENIRIVQTSYKIMFFNVYHCLFHFYP